MIGENGAGKSTLMKVLSGAHRPDSGTMQLEGKDYKPSGPNHARLSGVSMIYQELNLAPDLSVEDNIMLGAEYSKIGFLSRRRQRQAVRDALTQLGHGELQPTTIAANLSVGAQQLVEIARAIVMDARVIVFDEPFASLDFPGVKQVLKQILALHQTGHTILVITHDLEKVLAHADRLVIMQKGKIVKDGVPAEIVGDIETYGVRAPCASHLGMEIRSWLN